MTALPRTVEEINKLNFRHIGNTYELPLLAIIVNLYSWPSVGFLDDGKGPKHAISYCMTL